jgi:hypothetical protein
VNGAEVLWDQSPQAKIVSATFCCGFAPEFATTNYIPAAQIWGDGRIIWAQIDTDGKRRVLEGMLSQDQLANFLQSAVEQGFFGWKELYADPLSPTDLPTQCLYIQLESQSRTVCEYHEGAPQEFHELYDTLANGAGVTGKEFIPEKGYLVAFAQPAPDQAGEGNTLPAWDADTLGISLSQATQGTWIEGLALKTAWELLKDKPWGTAVQEKDSVYQISLQIPGVSMVEPPTQ